MSGYAHRLYAESLREFGQPRELPHCGGWVLERPIAGGPARDAMGCYPIFACRDWSRIGDDLDMLQPDLVALSLVTDPFGSYQVDQLRGCFDHVARFKDHLICDLSQPVERTVVSHHRYYARKALKTVDVEVCSEPTAFLAEWADLYQLLIERHHITGIKAFSRGAFAAQLATPGIVALRASSGGQLVGGQLWYVQGDVAYSHLTAFTPLGYQTRAAYAIYWYALNLLASRVRWLDLGAGAGTLGQGDAGLVQFKAGWSTGTRPVYVCGRVFDRPAYDALVQARGGAPTGYFPAYRQGEFG